MLELFNMYKLHRIERGTMYLPWSNIESETITLGPGSTRLSRASTYTAADDGHVLIDQQLNINDDVAFDIPDPLISNVIISELRRELELTNSSLHTLKDKVDNSWTLGLGITKLWHLLVILCLFIIAIPLAIWVGKVLLNCPVCTKGSSSRRSPDADVLVRWETAKANIASEPSAPKQSQIGTGV
jgi:hypothetical protein